MEAALLKVAAERVLKKSLQKDLGRLRQAYQVLRERIQAGVGISYGRCDDPDYLEFKRLATLFGVLLVSRSGKKTPTRAEAYEAFREITHNKHEKRWKRLEKRLADSSHAEPNASCHRHGR